MVKIHENVYVFVLYVNLKHESTKKHACFHVNFPFSAYFKPPPPINITS